MADKKIDNNMMNRIENLSKLSLTDEERVKAMDEMVPFSQQNNYDSLLLLQDWGAAHLHKKTVIILKKNVS